MLNISWKHVAIFICIFVPLGFVAWLILVLSDSAHWCGVIVGAGKLANIKPLVQDCGPILLSLIDKLGTLGLVLVITSSIGLCAWIIIGLGAKLSFRGPAGIGGEISDNRSEIHDGDSVTMTKDTQQ